MIKRNDGFTLIEMMVSIIVGTIATAAIATLLLLGIRMNAKTSEIATQDNQAVICLTVMENLIKENKIKLADGEFTEIKVIDDNNIETSLITYSSDKNVETSSGAVLLEDVAECKFSIQGSLITITLKLDEKGSTFTKTVRACTGQTIQIAP